MFLTLWLLRPDRRLRLLWAVACGGQAHILVYGPQALGASECFVRLGHILDYGSKALCLSVWITSILATYSIMALQLGVSSRGSL